MENTERNLLYSISIIIPVYNVEKYVAECIESIQSQTYKGPIECIIIDDCGTDNSMAIVKQQISAYNGPINFKIYQHKYNQGLSAARNTGIRAATGDYLIFVDSDDSIYPTAVDNLVQVLNKFPDADIIQGDTECEEDYLPYTALAVSRALYPNIIKDRRYCQYCLINRLPVPVWGKLICRRFIIENQLYFIEGMVHEDDMWRVNAAKFVSSIAFCFSSIYKYRSSNTLSITNQKDLSVRLLADIRIIQFLLKNLNKENQNAFVTKIINMVRPYRKYFMLQNSGDTKSINREIKKLKISCSTITNTDVTFIIKMYCIRGWLGTNALYRLIFNKILDRISQKYLYDYKSHF